MSNHDYCHLVNVFNSPRTYSYTLPTNLDPELECLICKTPYQPHDPEGCQAIKLHPCGHIIGHECFKQWIIRHPNACPYWSHHLGHTLRRAVALNQSIGETLLWLILNSAWIKFMDGINKIMIETLVSVSRPYYQDPREAFQAMATGNLTNGDVEELTHWSRWFTMGISCVEIGSKFAAAVLVVSIITHIFFFMVDKPEFVGTIWRIAWESLLGMGFVLGAHVCAYDVVVRCALKFGLRRSTHVTNLLFPE